MIVKVIKNYLPIDKCDELNSWVRDAIATDKILKGITTGHVEYPLRHTSRFYADRFEYPQIVRDIHAKIEKDFNLSKWHFPVHKHSRDATVVSATLPGGDVYEHIDPNMIQDLGGDELRHTLRCNILTSETEGGLVWVEGQSYSLKKGDMMQYLVSKYKHKVDTVIGNPGDLRIMWMFGWYVDAGEWEASINASGS